MDATQSLDNGEPVDVAVRTFAFAIHPGIPAKPLIGLAVADQWIGFNAAGYAFVMRWQHHNETWACIGLQRMADERDYPAAFLLDAEGKDVDGVAPIVKHIVLDSSVLRETKQ